MPKKQKINPDRFIVLVLMSLFPFLFMGVWALLSWLIKVLLPNVTMSDAVFFGVVLATVVTYPVILFLKRNLQIHK